MTRRYEELINMPVKDLVGYALDCAEKDAAYADLVEALAYCLDLEASGAELCMKELQERLEDAERRAKLMEDDGNA